MRIDLHGYILEEAIEEVLNQVNQAIFTGDEKLGIIHGYHQGHVLKDFFRSQKFYKEMNKIGFKIKRVGNRKNLGNTVFKIQLK